MKVHGHSWNFMVRSMDFHVSPCRITTWKFIDFHVNPSLATNGNEQFVWEWVGKLERTHRKVFSKYDILIPRMDLRDKSKGIGCATLFFQVTCCKENVCFWCSYMSRVVGSVIVTIQIKKTTHGYIILEFERFIELLFKSTTDSRKLSARELPGAADSRKFSLTKIKCFTLACFTPFLLDFQIEADHLKEAPHSLQDTSSWKWTWT